MNDNTTVNSTSTSTSLNKWTCTELNTFHTVYYHWHGWISLFVCVFGSIANTLNIVVLTRREMSSPTNAILTGLAVADLLVMVEYILYAIHLYLYIRPRRDTFTYGWASFVLFHANFAQVFHTISICLTVTLAVWRYIAVAHPQKNRQWCSPRRTYLAILAAYVLCPVICVPLYITTRVTPHVETLDANGRSYNLTNSNGTIPEGVRNTTLYFVRLTETAKTHSYLREMNFWIYSVVIKLIPCLALTVLSIRLIMALIQAKNRRKKLTANTAVIRTDLAHFNNANANSNAEAVVVKTKKESNRLLDKEKQTDRTTRMLLAVLLLFLITEFPQGILGLLSVLLGTDFFNACYTKLGDMMDILALINSAINFILYCAMSRQFRMTFNQLFCRWKLFGRWTPVPQHGENNGHTGTNHTVTQVTQV